MIDLKLDNEQLNKIVATYLFEQMPEERREEILRAALVHVFSTGTYGSQHTLRIQDIMHNAVRDIVAKRLEAEAADPESAFHKMIKEALDTLMQKLRDNPKPLVKFFEEAIMAGTQAAMKGYRGY